MSAAGTRARETRVTGCTSTVPPVPLPLCVPIHPSSAVWMYDSLRCPGVLGEEPLLSHGCFICCRLKGRDKGRVSCCHDADITAMVISLKQAYRSRIVGLRDIHIFNAIV